ncbi:MAG: endolytic transglycosylase MltG [Dermabacter sp.]|nr:endolytic transglycosylase MltG [Dermabacter sp.]
MADSSLDDLMGRTPDSGSREPGHGRRRAAKRQPLLVRLFPALLVILVLAGLGAGSYFGYSWVTQNVSLDRESDDFEGEGTGSVTIVVNDGDTGTDIARTMVDQGVIKTQGPFIAAFAANPAASNITPGSYQLREQMSSAEALKLLLDPASYVGIRVTIPEGITAEKVYERLSAATGIDIEAFRQAGQDYTARGVPENPAQSIEGYLWPGTYDFREDQTAEDILSIMVEQMKGKLTSKGIPEDRWHETLTMASIAEKEARTDEDFGKVVRTLNNRLEGVGEAGGVPMPLQLDSTIAYFHGIESVSTTPEQRATDSPYNTYMHKGLPIGPIANPGDATIDAVLNPPEGPWLYWVTVNTETGETKFSETRAQHDEYVREWQEWARNR